MFTYRWLLILITLVAWMESIDYQGMDLEAVKVCKGSHYQNILWVKESKRLEDFVIQFWVYWEALQVAAEKVLRLSKEAAVKYQRIAWFTIGPNSIHVQERSDPDRKWFSMPYKLFDVELEAMVNDWTA